MSEKMLTAEEIIFAASQDSEGSFARSIISLARQGMQPIPEAGNFREWWFGHGIKCPNDIGSIAEQTWVAAQSALLAHKDIVDLRKVWEANPRATNVVIYASEPGISIVLKSIDKPIPQWRPKEGEKYWIYYRGENVIRMADDKTSNSSLWDKGTKLAAAKSWDEIDWTWEQFLARGDCWEVQ